MNTNVKDRLRCAYEDCAEAHPLANESIYEQVTCLTCRAALGLPPTEIYKNSGATVAATPKPRAGEHTKGPWRTHDALVFFPDNAGGFSLQNCPSPKANARRIVACVNYCEGVSTAEIEAAPAHLNLRVLLDHIDGVTPKVMDQYDALLERERTLVEALRDLLDRVDRNGGLGEYNGGVPFATKTARELLAKHGR